MSVSSVGLKCCGCRTCQIVCKFNAISIVEDRYGFERVSIDKTLCKDCGACEKVCPALHIPTVSDRYVCGLTYSLNETERCDGSSGGVFGVFAKKVLSQNGCVYGAAFDTQLELKTTCAETESELEPLYKSKYLLCDINVSFAEMQKKLLSGQLVLYCASPCQVAALKLYLGKDYDNLILVDFACHGVGSQSLFNRSIEYMEKKLSGKVTGFAFRHKGKGSASHHYYKMTYIKKGKTISKEDLYFSFPYYNAYCKQLVCRESCYACQYATPERVSDITIGDFHNIEHYESSVDSYAGVSMFVCNTKRGQMFFDSVKDRLFVKAFPWEILKINNHFRGGSGAPEKQTAFMESVAKDTFDKTVSKFLKPSKDWVRLLYYKSPRFLRKMAKNLQR